MLNQIPNVSDCTVLEYEKNIVALHFHLSWKLRDLQQKDVNYVVFA